jgi:Zn-dependent peptidase ImmA (M78 family)
MIAIFPETLASAARGDIEELAIVTRRYYGGEEKFAPSPDIAGLVTRVGLEVKTLPIEGLGALVAKDEQGIFSITTFLSPTVDKAASRFLLAHMLGHYLLDIQPLIAKGDWQRSGFRETICPLRRYTQDDLTSHSPTFELAKEARADLFAAALLMPLGMVKRAMEAMQNKQKVARFFGVPIPCLERRLMDIGLVTKEPANFLDAEAALGLEKSKSIPIDEPPPLTAPTEPAMPRSFAASSYVQTARSTARDGEDGSASQEASTSSFEDKKRGPKKLGRPVVSRTVTGVSGDASSSRGGMQRLREIARQLDKNRG